VSENQHHLATAATANTFRDFDPGYPNVIVWDLASGDRIATLAGEDTWEPTSIAFDADGATLAVAISGGLDVKLWDVATRTERASVPGVFQHPWALFFRSCWIIVGGILTNSAT
jgi:WD40 repeat protein